MTDMMATIYLLNQLVALFKEHEDDDTTLAYTHQLEKILSLIQGIHKNKVDKANEIMNVVSGVTTAKAEQRIDVLETAIKEMYGLVVGSDGGGDGDGGDIKGWFVFNGGINDGKRKN